MVVIWMLPEMTNEGSDGCGVRAGEGVGITSDLDIIGK